MIFELPKTPFAANELQPVISAQTIEFHHGKHHLAYVNNLNALVPGTEFEKASLETIIKNADGPIFNNAAQIWNHTFYFQQFSANAGGEPGGRLGEAIKSDFGSFAEFKEKFTKSAVTLFGSGWAWLVKTPEGRLRIIQEANAGNPLKYEQIPILTFDVWEHAYYLDYQNRRPDHIAALWSIINWNVVERRF